MRAKRIPLLLFAALSMPGLGRAQVQDRFVLTPAQVAHALQETGRNIDAGQVTLPARVVASVPSPALDIVAIQPAVQSRLIPHPTARALVRLACRQPGDCLPFYALVRGLEPAAVTSASKPSRVAVNPQRAQFTMPAGTRATLVMDDNRSHIEVSVISLQNGMAGHWIRVASRDHKQIYYAEIVNANLLRGAF